MLRRVTGLLCVPYGIDHWQMDAIRLAGLSGRGLDFAAPFPFVMVSDDTLRLNQLRYQFASSATGGARDDAARSILASLLALCSPWDGTSRAFLASYFRCVEQALIHDQALKARAEPFKGLYQPKDWLFSAPAVLPRAHLFAPDFGPAKPVSEADFVAVAMAFRIKGQWLALISEAHARTPKAYRSQVARLEAQGVAVLDLPQTQEAQVLDALADQILIKVGPFWQDDPLPQGPFAPDSLAL